MHGKCRNSADCWGIGEAGGVNRITIKNPNVKPIHGILVCNKKLTLNLKFMKMSALKVMMMAGAMMVATCLTVNAAPVKGTPAHTTQDTTKKMKMKHGKMAKKMKMKKDTTAKM